MALAFASMVSEGTAYFSSMLTTDLTGLMLMRQPLNKPTRLVLDELLEGEAWLEDDEDLAAEDFAIFCKESLIEKPSREVEKLTEESLEPRLSTASTAAGSRLSDVSEFRPSVGLSSSPRCGRFSMLSEVMSEKDEAQSDQWEFEFMRRSVIAEVTRKSTDSQAVHLQASGVYTRGPRPARLLQVASHQLEPARLLSSVSLASLHSTEYSRPAVLAPMVVTRTLPLAASRLISVAM